MTSQDIIVSFEREEAVLQALKTRFVLLKAYQDEMVRRFGRKHFEIRNDHIWRLVLDARVGLVVDFTSWAKGMCQKGGFFGRLHQARPRLYIAPPTSRRFRDAAPLERRVATNRRKSFERSFPDAISRNKVLPNDVDALRDRFSRLVAQIKADRNLTLAHLYEKDAALKRRLLTPRGYRRMFQDVEELMNDLRMLLLSSTYPYYELSVADATSVAGDLVDMVVGGDVLRLVHVWGVDQAVHTARGKHAWEYREDWRGRTPEDRHR